MIKTCEATKAAKWTASIHWPDVLSLNGHQSNQATLLSESKKSQSKIAEAARRDDEPGPSPVFSSPGLTQPPVKDDIIATWY